MKNRFFICLLAALILIPMSAWAQKKNKDKDKKEEKDKFAETIKDTEHYEGLFDAYYKDGHLYFAIPESQFGQKFMANFEIARGVGADGLYGGTMLNIFEGLVLSFEKREDKIALEQHTTHYTGNDDPAISRANELTYGNSILEMDNIIAKKEKEGEETIYLVDVYKWFVSDISGVGDRVKSAVSERPGKPGRASLDPSRSYLEDVKSFPENTNIQAKLTFKTDGDNSPRTVPDGRYIPVSIHYTLAKLPENPMVPRVADDRVGYFLTVHKNFAEDDKTFFERFTNRWRLECADEPDAGELCEPKEPITYYIEQTVPETYREALIDGVDAWQDAFEAAGFKNAIVAKMLPEDADAEDIRYPTLRWNTSDQTGYGAIGPSVVDPRTGEILDADILFEASMVLGFKNSWRNIISPGTAFSSMYNVSEAEKERLKAGVEHSSFSTEFTAQGSMLKSALLASGKLSPNEPVPEDYVQDAMKWVTMHEVGHTLGLRHNFRASSDTPLDQLYNENFTAENGIYNSVMEYPTINLPEGGDVQGHIYNPGIGSYDRWAISYAYTPDEDKAKEIARKAAYDGHQYGTDLDARGPWALDPTINVYDLGEDPLAWGETRIQLVQGLMADLPEFVLADNVPYYEVTNAFGNLFSQYARAVAPAVKYLGGAYLNRDHKGDPQGRKPLEPIARADQERALEMISATVFDEDAFVISQEVLQSFGTNRWSHWGNNPFYSGRLDFPYHKMVVGFQTSVLTQLTSPYRLSRIRDNETKYGSENTVSIPEVIGTITNNVWSEVWAAPGSNISAVRRDLQRAYLDRMITFLTDTPEYTPADAVSVIRVQLEDLHERLSNRLTPPYDFNDYTYAHLKESKERIAKALDASISIK